MPIYYRMIESVVFKVCVSEKLKADTLMKVDTILMAFDKNVSVQEMACKECTIYLDVPDSLNEAGRKRIIVQEDDIHWIFILVQSLEDIMVEELNCTTLHGTCLMMDNECFALIGARLSGKTTLTQTLLKYDSVKLVGDDVICVLGDSVSGLGTPLLIRSSKANTASKQLCTIDDDGQIRMLYSAKSSQVQAPWPNYLIFPQYNASCSPRIDRLKYSEVFIKLMQNIRHHDSLRQLKRDVLQLANIPAYSIIYPSQQIALELLKDVILCMRKISI